MKSLRLLCLAAAASAVFSHSALASGDDAKVTVTPLPNPATLSTNRTNYAAYNVKVENVSLYDAVKILKLSGSTKVLLAGYAAPFTAPFFNFSTTTGIVCVATSVDLTAIQCDINDVLNPGESLNFVVIFKTPVATALQADAIKFSTRTKYLEYESGESYSEPESDVESVSKSATTSLAAVSANQVDSYLPASAVAQTVFTGTGATPNAQPDDQITTTVKLPTTPTGTTARIVEETLTYSGSCAAVLNQCFASTITIPGVTFNPTVAVMPIFLRFDKTAIGPVVTSSTYYKTSTPNIKNLIIDYSSDGITFAQVANCAKDYWGNPKVTTGPYGLPRPGVPCIARRTAFGKYAPVPVVDQGDWLIEIWAVDNGRYVTR
jgi:hypothetical protein